MLVAIKSVHIEFLWVLTSLLIVQWKFEKEINMCGLTINSIVGDYDKPNFQVEFPLQWFHARKQIEMPNNVQLSCVLI